MDASYNRKEKNWTSIPLTCSVLFCSWGSENNYVHMFQKTIGVEGCIQQNKIPVFKQKEKVFPLDGAEGKPVGHLITD